MLPSLIEGLTAIISRAQRPSACRNLRSGCGTAHTLKEILEVLIYYFKDNFALVDMNLTEPRSHCSIMRSGTAHIECGYAARTAAVQVEGVSIRMLVTISFKAYKNAVQVTGHMHK